MLWYNRKVYIWSVKIPKKLVTCKKHKFLSGLENTFLLETVYIGNKYSNIVLDIKLYTKFQSALETEAGFS